MEINSIDNLNSVIKNNLNLFKNELLDEVTIESLINIIDGAVNTLHENQLHRLREINKITIAISHEKNLNKLLDMVLYKAIEVTNSDAGTLYLKDASNKKLIFTAVQNRSKNIRLGGIAEKITWNPLNLFKEDSQANTEMVAVLCALTNRPFLIDDVYNYGSFNFKGAKEFDKMNSYRTKSMLVVPMKNYKSHIIGVLQLINKMDNDEIVPFDIDDRDLTISFASGAAAAITRARQDKLLEYKNSKVQRQKELLEEFLIRDDSSAENENKTVEKKSEVENKSSDKISAIEYMQEVDGDMLEHVYEMEELDGDWFDILDRGDFSREEKISKIANIIIKYGSSIKILLEFNNLANALKSLGENLLNLENPNEDIIKYLDKIQEVLAQWKQTIFIEKSSDDIHYLDNAIIKLVEYVGKL